VSLGKCGLNRLVTVVLMVVMSLSLLLMSGCGEKEAVEKENKLSVSVTQVKLGTIQKMVDYTGTLQGMEEAQLIPRMSARVMAVKVKPGDQVKQGQVLVQLDNKDMAAPMISARANLTSAQSTYQRTLELFKQGAVSQQQLDGAKTALDVAQAQYQGAAATAANAVITSPINGTVGAVYVKEGDTANPAAPALVVSNLSQLETEIAVNESDIVAITAGATVKVKINAAGDKEFAGVITAVSPVADTNTKSYPVRVRLSGDITGLKSGMFALVNLATVKKESVVVIPSGAVSEKGAAKVVYVLQAGNKVHEVEVETGLNTDKEVEIISGVKAGETIEIKGQTLRHKGNEKKVVKGGQK